MKEKVKEEVKSIILELDLNCTIKDFKEVVDWRKIYFSKSLSNNIKTFREIDGQLHVDTFCRDFSDEFYEEFQEYIDWEYVSQRKGCSESFIRRFKNKLNWKKLDLFDVSESFIREFYSLINWENIPCYGEYSEEFLRNFQNKLDWKKISEHQDLSEVFIKEMADKVDWNLITLHQELSEDFIRDFQECIDWHSLPYSIRKFSEAFLREFQDRLEWRKVSEYQSLSRL